jgi:hypothetical protein
VVDSRLVVVGVALLAIAVVISQGVAAIRLEYAVGAAFVVAVFIFAFMSMEGGLYLVLLSMLLSPEFALGGGSLAEKRMVVLRLEDVLLLVILFSWLARMALHKDLGLIAATTLNRPIFAYVLATLFATLVGFVTGTVKTTAGFFYVLKYVEYFVVYFITVNLIRDRNQAWRLVMTAFLTAIIVSLIGMAQIPGGERVSAPFEGESGEPNTFGGYLLFMMAIASGIALETRRLPTRVASLAAVGIMALPFAFTLSRSSYLGLIPMTGALALLSQRRRAMLAVFAVVIVTAPLTLAVAPPAVSKRVLFTFKSQADQPTVRVGGVAFDPSTSERLMSTWEAVEAWTRRPVLGFGVTGFRFMDAQYARTLVETGLLGLITLGWLARALIASGMRAYRTLHEPEDRGLAVGFVAGTVGLLVHAVGANTFIIIRVMEPFWFFAAVIVVLTTLSAATPATPSAPTPGPVRIRPPFAGVRV